MMKETNKNIFIYLIIGIIIGVVIAPYLKSEDKGSDDLVQYIQRSMGENFGEVIEIEEISGTNLSAVRVLYVLEQPNNGAIEEKVGAVVKNSDGIEIGDKVKLLDVVHYNKQQGSPLWARYLETEDFIPLNNL